jgi:hypothetical protein
MARNYDIMGDVGGGVGPSFMKKKKYGYSDQEGQTASQATAEGAGRLKRFGDATKGASSDDIVGRLQKYAQGENDRKKAEAAKKKQQEEADTETVYDEKTKQYIRKKKTIAPEKGFIQRMMDKYWYGKKDEE